MEKRTTYCRSCLDPLVRRIPADTSTQTKMPQAHNTSKTWPNSLDPQRSHTERPLANWKNISFRRQRRTAVTSVRSEDKNGTFKISAIRLALIEAEERIQHDDDSDDDAEEAKPLYNEQEHNPAKTNSINTTTEHKTALV